MAISYINSVVKFDSTNGGTTSAIDTSSADFIVVGVSSDASTDLSETVTDNKSNTFTALTSYSVVNARVRIFYCVDATTGTGHTFTFDTTNDTYPAIMVSSFSGVTGFDKQDGTGVSSTNTVTTGSITPTDDNSLIVCYQSVAGIDDSTADAGFTELSRVEYSLTNYSGSRAYLIQGTAAAVSPGFTSLGVMENRACATAIFSSVLPDIEGDGGAEAGGSAEVTAIYDIDGTGGAVVGGSALVTGNVFDETADGGAVAGGNATPTVIHILNGEGGVVSGGIAEVNLVFNIEAQGGVVIGGPTFANGFQYRSLITIPAGTVASDLDKFHVGIKATLDSALVFTGTDFQFETTDETLLAHELRDWDGTTMVAFVKTPLLANTDNTFYLYYGNANA